jgi:hypothetical protein
VVRDQLERAAYEHTQDLQVVTADVELVRDSLRVSTERLREAMHAEPSPQRRQELARELYKVVGTHKEVNALAGRADPHVYATIREFGPLGLEPGMKDMTLTRDGRDKSVTVAPGAMEVKLAELARTAHGGRFPDERQPPAPEREFTLPELFSREVAQQMQAIKELNERQEQRDRLLGREPLHPAHHQQQQRINERESR